MCMINQLYYIRRTLCFIVFFFLCNICINGQEYLSVMSYNCENLFDTIHDSGKDDYAYLKDGEYNWSRKRLFSKLKGIAKVISAIDIVRPVDIIALCEVENDSILRYLSQYTKLRNLAYKYFVTNSLDKRGIDVALLYSPFTFHPLTDARIIRPLLIENHKTRDILQISGTINNGDTIDIYVCHLPSQIGGKASFNNSYQVAKCLRCDIDSVIRIRSTANIIVMGDFNADVSSSIIKTICSDDLIDLISDKKPGTYKYKGQWSCIDHIFVSKNMFNSKSVIRASFDESGIFCEPFLLEEDKTYGGYKPKRTFIWRKYNRGLSDHLPVWAKFRY